MFYEWVGEYQTHWIESTSRHFALYTGLLRACVCQSPDICPFTLLLHIINSNFYNKRGSGEGKLLDLPTRGFTTTLTQAYYLKTMSAMIFYYSPRWWWMFAYSVFFFLFDCCAVTGFLSCVCARAVLLCNVPYKKRFLITESTYIWCACITFTSRFIMLFASR